ncbi:Gluconate transport-inducing protein [Cladophialophora chaetospira]|uniref:Gluconate transport-inducing protein n=1 Tax=Cladophialophora chaetospira TaxID=386627 RepID=A0AA38XDW1_9EURO|nr:Gluconate transport-inducing protein [Cladophialophora chaetospira]
METYNGLVRTPTDAIILFEACRMGILPRVQRRLSEKERQSIRSGSVFVWDEREAGMRRWTDGKSWSASRVSGSFLTYREMEGKRGGNSYANQPNGNRGTKTPEAVNEDASQGGEGEEGPDGYRYKPDGLMKQSFSITTSTGQHLHLISYYSRSHPASQVLRQPSTDPNLANITPAKGMYPESTINDQSAVPAVTRSPMVGAPGYVMSPGAPGYHRPGPSSPQAYLPPGYMPHPAYLYPISPMHTPPPGYQYQPYAMPHGMAPLPYGAAPYHHSPHAMHLQAPPSSYDQRPLRNSDTRSSVPPPPPASSGPIAPASYSVIQSPANYQMSPPAPPATSAPEPPAENAGSALQIDPRLTSPPTSNDAQPNGVASRPEDNQPPAQPSDTIVVSASQAPTINALVHNINTKIPAADRANESDVDRQGSTSPGGTKNGAPPQDIPSEKLGFREDKRALSKLDRVFAKV